MCAITGIFTVQPSGLEPALVQQQLAAMAHRGPDGSGTWHNSRLYLGHNRLSVLDTSAAAHQPFIYGKYVLVFNGAIYNYIELKQTLQAKGYTFTTQGDTEVIPAVLDAWGIEGLNQLDGMFAFALYNTETETLLIVRDRLGEKPLYYFAQYANRGELAKLHFASEIKAFWAAQIPKQVNGTMLLNYLGTGMLQNPQKLQASFYNNILCLPAGHYLQLQIPTAKLTMKRWYWPQQKIKEASEQIFSPEQLLKLLTTSVQQRLRSHVTVGASLSGGIDSAAIVALAAPHTPLTTYTAVFENFEKNEAQRAKTLLQHVPNTKGLDVAPTVADFHQYFSAFIHQQDEPVQSASAFVQYCVYKAAQQHGTTVLLDGQGADELLGGYTRHTQWYVALQAKQHFWQALQQGKQLYNNGFLASWLNPSLLAGFFPNYSSQYLSKKALQQIQQVPIEPGFLHKYQNLSSIEKPVIQQWQQVLYYDTFINGLSTLLRYADRNSMAFGREVRLPFLQHQLVAYCLAMPNDVKIHQGFTKWILRKAVEPLLPTGYGWQPGKIGYEPPQKQWMLHPTSQAMVAQAKEKLIAAQVLSPKALHQKWAAVSAHENDWNWRVLNAAAILP